MSFALARVAMSVLAFSSSGIECAEAHRRMPSTLGDVMHHLETRAPAHRRSPGSATGAAPPSFAQVNDATNGETLMRSTTDKPTIVLDSDNEDTDAQIEEHQYKVGSTTGKKGSPFTFTELANMKDAK
mmetsp:Transcript_31671/g.95736  ORF Transcript_31671/g.95736 Transcript_31671/m.95736 type:complete len:128 (-) Transcript_31671:224-607(-)|eukprot:CAMPEP_0198493530 /NCGR_PEP_ID=MMETSP1462-20131121/4075_1 /TAXON_ID=1333877 /ORGANISM="Brandtodinium nutriculum, Strain RCC3387" /LENGTH=127 /DNA_ID=CAMNT_0044222225 /DNA_START=64 /DNA_END=447 /DNA_ORIENTATION=+